MYIVTIKVISILGVFLCTLASGLLSYKVLKCLKSSSEKGSSNGKLILSCLNAFSGGIFLGVCLIHLLPSVRQQINAIMTEYNTKTTFPCAECLISIGFFLIIIIEQVIILCHSGLNHISKRMHHCHEDSVNTSSVNQPTGVEYRKYGTISNSSENHPSAFETKESGFPSETQSKTSQNGKCIPNSVDNSSEELTKDEVVSIDSAFEDSKVKSAEVSPAGQIEPSTFKLKDNQETDISALRSLLLLLALSLHTIFDGLAVGLVRETSQLLTILIAVVVHKILVAFSLGLQIFENGNWSVRRSVFLLVIFSSISPVGIAIGILVVPNINPLVRNTATAALKGLATGTFFYVTFFEILGRELSHHSGLLTVLFAILGFSGMTGLFFVK